MIATVILLIVIIATAKIFDTVTSVTGIGEATADVLQEASAIEQQIRQDLGRISDGGFVAINSHAVRNDVNLSTGGGLLDPALPDFASLRSDQLVFFVNGVQNTRNFSSNPINGSRKQQALTSRVYYGHAFQVPNSTPGSNPAQSWAPWRTGNLPMLDRNGANAGSATIPTIPANRWLLSRQALLLADDGGETASYFGDDNSVRSIWNDFSDPDSRPWNGRRDIAATGLNDVRSTITTASNVWFRLGAAPGEILQANFVDEAVYFPRAERLPPVSGGSGADIDFVRRDDHALTSSVIGSACSDFIVEWTYEENVGASAVGGGIGVPRFLAQPWFGFEDASRDVISFRRYLFENSTLADANDYLNPQSIELPVFNLGGTVRQYKAYFGYNRTQPLDVFDADGDNDFDEGGLVESGFTPWPTAIRITMTLHDPEGRLASGRVFQFVVDLPRVEP
jgi:hypothetical protein